MPNLDPSAPSNERPFSEHLRAFGCTDVVELSREAATPAQLEYLDLIPKRGHRNTLPVPVAAIAEHQGTALLYLVDGRRSGSLLQEEKLSALQHELANRSDPAYLGVVSQGSLDIYPIDFNNRNKNPSLLRALQKVNPKDRAAPLFFQSLVHGQFGGLHKKGPRSSDYVYRIIMKLLDGTTAEFGADPTNAVPGKLPPLAVLSLAGRALFFRFVVDRGVVVPEERGEICPSADDIRRAFATARSAAETSAWLDKTFNGDFLPLINETIPSENQEARRSAYANYYQDIHDITNGSIFTHLDAILRGWDSVDGKHVQPTFDFNEDWSDLNFAHIPVGVLSQVYENFSHRADGEFAKSTSVYYTPRTIARFLVDEAFESLGDPAHASVLDPACGAGIFLVLTLRRLVKERWQKDNQPPNAETIRHILYNQIRGFDISESALRLAALGLYITAIEVNQSPRPPKSLKFPRNLRNTVLFNFNEFQDQPGMEKRIPLGSLGSHVLHEKFDRHFNLVLGNPPWTALKAPTPVRTAARAAQRQKSISEGKAVEKEETTKLNEYFTGIANHALLAKASIAKAENHASLAASLEEVASNYENPRKNPDLPFLWRATQWAVEGGTIAFVLPARLYLLGPNNPGHLMHEDESAEASPQEDGTDHNAWRALMKGIAITGIINGSDLRKTGVWRGVDVPFSILFAKNELPTPQQAFRFASPLFETRQNELGRFRIDYQSDVLVSCREVQQKPWLLKTLALGNSLDVSLIERLLAAFPQTLGQYWQRWDNSGGMRTGQGYNLSSGLTAKNAEFLAKLPDFERPDGFAIDYEKLQSFKENHHRESAHLPRTEFLYQAPLVIIPKSPHEQPWSPKAFLASKATAFSQINYGYSCHSHPEADLVASLLYLLPHSSMFLYFVLMTCPSFGADRQMFLKRTLDSVPFPDPAKLSSADKACISDLAKDLQTASIKPWEQIDALFARLYGLGRSECELIADTLFSVAPYRTKGAAAFQPVGEEQAQLFNATLQEALEPFLAITARSVAVRPADFPQDLYRNAWYFVEVVTNGQRVSVTPELLQEATAAANESGASRVVIRANHIENGLLLGQIAQCRWWTKTRARLCGIHIIYNHLDALRPPELVE